MTLRLEPPFYLPEAVDQFLTPLLPPGSADIPLTALEDPAICEALNQALRLSAERAV